MVETSDLLGANLEVRNEKGEIIFAMKRKDTYPPLYYLFEKHEDKMNDKEKKGFEQVWPLIKKGAAAMGFALHDMKEINEALQAQIKAVIESKEGKAAREKAAPGGDEKVFIKDISFKVYDHATGNLGTLTVGVSTMSAEGAKNISADNKPKQKGLFEDA